LATLRRSVAVGRFCEASLTARRSTETLGKWARGGVVMSHELFYTSAPRGLQPGSNGFCTVAETRGLSPLLRERLEDLSGYRPLFPPNDPRAVQNPVASSHLKLTVSGKTLSVLSRVCASGLDHTGRSTKFAHHVVLPGRAQPPTGPGR